jgi:hypothetical protein
MTLEDDACFQGIHTTVVGSVIVQVDGLFETGNIECGFQFPFPFPWVVFAIDRLIGSETTIISNYIN